MKNELYKSATIFVQLACGSGPEKLRDKNLYALAYVCLGILGITIFRTMMGLYRKQNLMIENILNEKHMIKVKEYTV